MFFQPDPADAITRILKENPELTSREILDRLKDLRINISRKEVNRILYTSLRDKVIKDTNSSNLAIWRLRGEGFEASKGKETIIWDELTCLGLNPVLDFPVENYRLDLVLKKGDKKLDIEVDGFEHIRLDAKISIEKQIQKNGEGTEIKPDWLKNKTSFADFKNLKDQKSLNVWLAHNIKKINALRYELLRPLNKLRDQKLKEKGFNVIRFWNTEVENDFDKCIEEIMIWYENA